MRKVRQWVTQDDINLVNHCCASCVCLQREPEREEQLDPSMPPKFKRHLNDEEVTGSIRSERVSQFLPYRLTRADWNWPEPDLHSSALLQPHGALWSVCAVSVYRSKQLSPHVPQCLQNLHNPSTTAAFMLLHTHYISTPVL